MVGTLREKDSRKTSEIAQTIEALPEPQPLAAEEEARRLPVLGVVLSFIVLFWGGVILLWAFLPHHHS